MCIVICGVWRGEYQVNVYCKGRCIVTCGGEYQVEAYFKGRFAVTCGREEIRLKCTPKAGVLYPVEGRRSG